MNNTDKKRLKDAYNEVVSKSPHKDSIVKGILVNGQPTTVKDLTKEMLNDPKFYNVVEKLIEEQNTDLDSFIKKIPANFNFKPKL